MAPPFEHSWIRPCTVPSFESLLLITGTMDNWESRTLGRLFRVLTATLLRWDQVKIWFDIFLISSVNFQEIWFPAGNRMSEIFLFFFRTIDCYFPVSKNSEITVADFVKLQRSVQNVRMNGTGGKIVLADRCPYKNYNLTYQKGRVTKRWVETIYVVKIAIILCLSGIVTRSVIEGVKGLGLSPLVKIYRVLGGTAPSSDHLAGWIPNFAVWAIPFLWININFPWITWM